MNPPLTDDVWIRRGVSVLWDGQTLARLAAAPRAVSLRRLFTLSDAGWPEEEIRFIDDTALLVAGLDAALDALDPDEAEDWLGQSLYPRIVDFQTAFDGQCALIFWMADRARWCENSAEGVFDWHLAGRHKGRLLPLARCLWDGAYLGVRRIEETAPGGKLRWIGLYLQRIS